MKLYHVVENYDGGDLLSLYEQYGDRAYELFLDKWPESGELGHYHAHYIHLYSSVDDARKSGIYGEILEIDIPDTEIQCLLEIDTLEFPHPMIRDCLPKRYINNK